MIITFKKIFWLFVLLLLVWQTVLFCPKLAMADSAIISSEKHDVHKVSSDIDNFFVYDSPVNEQVPFCCYSSHLPLDFIIDSARVEFGYGNFYFLSILNNYDVFKTICNSVANSPPVGDFINFNSYHKILVKRE